MTNDDPTAAAAAADLPACVEVVVAADDAEFLAGLTRSLVERRLVACGQTIPAIRSVYRWDGAVHDDPQARVALHTRAELVEQLLDAVRADHPDDVPCVIALPILGGNPDYLRWVHAETSAASDTAPGEP